MAARVTATEVQAILVENDLTDITVESFIAGATALVDAALASSSLSDALLKEIERYYTAHLISSTVERMALKEGAGGASITYTGGYGGGLDSTSYGQTVKALDTTGKMAALGGKAASTYAIKSTD